MGSRHGHLGLLSAGWFTTCLLLLALPVAAAASTREDPPALMARLARLEGRVSVRFGAEDGWRLARPNLPLAPGDAVWTEPGGQAVLDIAASRIDLDGGTEFRLEALDAPAREAMLTRGRAYLRLLHGEPGTTLRIRTPRAVASLMGDGRYVIDTGDAARPGTVTVLEGAARVQVGDGATTSLAAGEAATLSGPAPYRTDTVPAHVDEFAVAMMALDPRLAEATPAIARDMTGIGDLAQYGDWRDTQDHGAAWLPHVPTGWAPYRNGIWAWMEPWGWTWVDDAPWGFAPFHYGRWTRIGGSWAWVPARLNAGVGFRPAFAPALVAFLGLRRMPGQTVAPPRTALSAIGWAPLAPGESYQPWFPSSEEFRRRLNLNHVRQGVTPSAELPLENLDAATVLPAAAMLASGVVRRAPGHILALPADRLERLAGADLPAPTLSTWGIGPLLARRLGLTGATADLERPLVLPMLRPAGAASQRLPGAAPGPLLPPAYPGWRDAPTPR